MVSISSSFTSYQEGRIPDGDHLHPNDGEMQRVGLRQ